MEASATVRVPLTIEERADRADQMARLVARIEGVEAEAKEQASIFREDIKGLEAELRSLAANVREGVTERAQMDLTFTQAQAAAALARVGTASCICAGGPRADVKDPDCAVHGVETRGENPAVDEQGPIPAGVDELAADLVSHGVVAGEGAAEAAADYVVPEGAGVDLPTPEEPKAVADFHAAKARRGRRA